MKVLVLSGPNHRFADSASVIHNSLAARGDMSVELTDDKEVLRRLNWTSLMSVCSVLDSLAQSVSLTALLSENQILRPEPGRWSPFQFVSSGKGLVGIHGTAWWIGGRAVDLIGGAANWHPPGATFTVNIDDSDHPITQGVDAFEVEDEIYMSAYDPYLHILASAEWSERQHPMAW